ncbi:MAG: DUF6146 family protein [Bacteroidota bacterium]|nr:DUF6146 family protein [Bacteroidota bacterium]
MKKLIYLVLIFAIAGIWSCGLNKKMSTTQTENQVSLSSQSDDSTEYEILIIDPGFGSWFITHRKPKWYHEQSFLENWNLQYVSAWNLKVMSGAFQLAYPNNPFIERIEYRPFVDYGLDVNHKLYYYFKYIEATWGRVLD